MQENTGGLLSPVLVDLTGKRGLVKVESGTLAYWGLSEEERGPRVLCELEQELKYFECLVTERGRLYVIMVDINDVISGVTLGNEAWIKLFEPFKTLGTVRSLSLAPGLNSDVNVFFASATHKGAKLYHYRVDQGRLKHVSVLNEGGYDDFAKLKSICDLWGSINLFYLIVEKGVSVLQHQFYVPFNKTWSEPVTLYGADQGKVDSFSTIIDSDNKNYLALLLEGAIKHEIIYFKRELGGWPKGGWQRAILISQEEKKGLPVIEFFRKDYLQILFYCEGDIKLYVWRDGEVKSLQKKELSAEGRPLLRFRSTSPWHAEWTLAGESMVEEMRLQAATPAEGGRAGEGCLQAGENRPKGYEGTQGQEGQERQEGQEIAAKKDTSGGPDKETAVRQDQAGSTESGAWMDRAAEMADFGSEGLDNLAEGVSEDLEGRQREERDRFVRQAVQIMQAKTDLEAALRRKDKEMAKQKSVYESKIRLLKDQLASRQEAFKSLEAKMARQEASAMGFKTEQRAFEREMNQQQKENQELKEQLKKREKERREQAIQIDNLKKQLEDLQEKLAIRDKNPGFLGKLGGFLKK